MTKKQQKVAPKMKIYPILVEAVERGVAYGYMRAHKHIDKPDEETMKSQIQDAVMSELCEVIDFGDD
jgi:hypothetical protein